MACLRFHSPLLKYITVFTCCLSLLSCQDKSDGQGMRWFSEDDSRQEVVVPASFTPESAQKLGHRVDSLFRYLHKKKGFNGTVLITKYDQVLYKGAIGYANFRQKDTLSTQTAFQLASVSKQFTAMAIMMLQEEGDLQYDDSVQQHLPDFPYKGITIRQLLTHRSGLPNYTNFSETLWPDRKKDLTNSDVMHLMQAHRPRPNNIPGRSFEYSNTGYVVLASIVEEVSGVPFDTFLRENIFEPLKMDHTFTFLPEAVTQTGGVAGGHLAGKRKRESDYLDTVLGDKGIYSTVEDLYKWDQALYTQKLVKFETITEAFTGAWLDKRKKDEDYGYGWRIKPLENGDTAVYHGGLWHGYSTYILRNPKDHSAIIVLSNLTNGSLNYLKDLRRLLYPAAPTQSGKRKQAKIAHVK